MNIWLPNALYQVFPLLCVNVGFLLVLLVHNPLGIAVALCLYVYSFWALWKRIPCEEGEAEREAPDPSEESFEGFEQGQQR